METVAALTAELSQESYSAAVSRAEALRSVAMAWLKERQARRGRLPTAPPSSAPEAERVGHCQLHVCAGRDAPLLAGFSDT